MAARGSRDFYISTIMVLVLVAVAYVATHWGGGGGTMTVRDGGFLKLACGSGTVPKIMSAEYGPAPGGAPTGGCPAHNVETRLADWASHSPEEALEVGPGSFPGAPACQGAPRVLAVEYSCVPRGGEDFLPQRADVCESPAATPDDPDPDLHLWAGEANENWTVPVVPWDPESKIQLTAAALTPSARPAHRPINPITRIGVTSRIRVFEGADAPPAGGDISSGPCSSAPSIYDVQSFQTGYLHPATNDSTDGTMTQQRYHYPASASLDSGAVAGPYGGPYKTLAKCPEDLGIDSDFVSDGSYETMTVGLEMAGGASQQPWTPPPATQQPDDVWVSSAAARERLRSRPQAPFGRPAAAGGCLSGAGCGLGSVWVDPRFQPGPAELYDGGDAVHAHGGHAGGPTFGSFTAADYVPAFGGGASRYIRGAGDGDLAAPY